MKQIYSLLTMILITTAVSAQEGTPVQVKTDKGIVEGISDPASGLQTFFGIPFAKPPVAELRWKAPQPMDAWRGVKQTKQFGPRAMQAPVFGDMHFRSNGMSEDCLYLNVWAPVSRGNQSRYPVLVYFYGGGFVAGDGSEPRYDGASMAKKGIVVITVNYRLNIFGFFAHPELSKEASYKASGNYGLLDQHAGLIWVKKNIAAFGGDPSKITIAGESAGSISVSAHMASPLSRHLIAGAIGESGAAINPTLAPIPLAEAEKTGLDFARAAGYHTLAALRALSTEQIFKVYNDSRRFGFPTVIDEYFYPKSVPEIFKAKEQAPVPLLLGWNSAEIPAAAFMHGLPNTPENFERKVKEAFPVESDASEVLKLYAHSNEKEVEWSATALASDRFISYSTWKWFDLHRKNSNQPVYRYLYSKLRPPLRDQNKTTGLAGGTSDRTDGFKAPEPIGAPHACEIEYCMGNLYLVPEFAWTGEDYKVSEVMLNYFANFIKTGNPNGESLPVWPAAAALDETPAIMIIDVTSKATESTDQQRYEFLDRFYKNR